MNCKYLKLKLNKTLYCKLYNKLITYTDCKVCNNYELIKKDYKPLKSIKNKLVRKQNNRFSIIYQDFTKCCLCKAKNTKIELNEVFEGAKRITSIENGFVMPLCKKCHNKFHNDRKLAVSYKQLFQTKFEETHTREEFIKLIHHNYL